MLDFKVLAQPRSTAHAIQERQGLQTDSGCERQKLSSKGCQAGLHDPDPGKAQSTSLANASISSVCTTSPMLQLGLISGQGKIKKKSEWLPDLPVCSDKPITVLIATHPHESWSEQPGTSLHCQTQRLIKTSRKNNCLIYFCSSRPSFSHCGRAVGNTRP